MTSFVNLLLEYAPWRQRYPRMLHILFHSGGALDSTTRKEVFLIAVKYLKEGFSTSDIHQFQCWSSEDAEWSLEDCVISPEHEAAVEARAEEAVQAAATQLLGQRHSSGSGATGSKDLHLTPRRRRLESAELHELSKLLRLAEVYADMHDYDTMRRSLRHLLILTDTLPRAAFGSDAAERSFAHLEVCQRCVELCLSAGDLDTVRSIFSVSVASYLEDAVGFAGNAQGCSDTLRSTPLQQTAGDVVSEMELYVLFFSVVRGLLMFEDGDFGGFARVFTPSGLRGAVWAPEAEALISKKSAPRVTALSGGRAIASLSIPTTCNLRFCVEKSITSRPQLGVMVLFSAIAALPRKEAMELITRLDILQLWDDVREAHAFVHALQQAKWSEALSVGSILALSFLKTDLFAHKHGELLYSKVRERIVLEYVSMFVHLDLKNAAVRLSITLEQLEEMLRKFIVSGCLHARIDFVSHLLARVDTFENTAEESLHFSSFLDCIRRSDKCAADVEQSLRILSLHRNYAC